MMQHELEKLTGRRLTVQQFEALNSVYMESNLDIYRISIAYKRNLSKFSNQF